MRTLHPNLARWLESHNALLMKAVASGFRQTPVNARDALAKMTKNHVKKIPWVAWVQDDYVITPHYNVPVRIYHPDPGQALPVLIYYHGGGHVSGSVAVYDAICRKMALATRHIIVCPEYRLAPECPYPSGLEDALGVAKHVWATLNARGLRFRHELSLAGDSAGGALAASVSGRAQHDAGMSIRRQVLIYPSLDYTMGTPSVSQNGNGYLLQKERLAWFFDSYFSQCEDRKAASPLFWDMTQRMPETLVITAEFCPLRDEGVMYAGKIREAGVGGKHIHYQTMIHAFINLEDIVPDACRSMYAAIGDFMQK